MKLLVRHSFPILLTLSGVAALSNIPALAQITPDDTLGAENSVVVPDVMINGLPSDQIDGGALRGAMLFHSFEDFNIAEGRGAYFSNPDVVNTIFSRVTGANRSDILGTLGVLGNADLVFLNPNGILFGPDAQLDLRGSFTASTASEIEFPNGEKFSVLEPELPSLLTMNVEAPVGLVFENAGSESIVNEGILVVTEDLILSANSLDLQGQLYAGQDLTLQAHGTVKIRDSETNSFITAAGNQLIVQGDQSIDIFALNHPDSVLFSGGDMTLRSDNPINGDAHYWSEGNFQVETLDEEAGDLFSPVDPIIRAFGDVMIGAYQGSSLHILAGGSVDIGTAFITAPDAGTINVDFLQETIQLSDGTVIEVNGGAQPTLDIRAGVSTETIGSIPFGNPSGVNPTTDFFLTRQIQPAGPEIGEVATSANISVGDVFLDDANGLVLLTNQYEPNPEIEGSILITGEGAFGYGIDARGFDSFSGGAVYLDARDDVAVINSSIETSGPGTVGDIVINAEDTVRFELQNRPTVVASALLGLLGDGTGGDVVINANTLEVLNGAQLVAANFGGDGNAGNVKITVRDRARFDGISPNGQLPSAAFSSVELEGNGDAGDVIITADVLEVTNGARLFANTRGNGDAGNVEIVAQSLVRFDGGLAFSSVDSEAIGKGGDVRITAGIVEVLNGAGLRADTSGNGDAGNIEITARDLVQFDQGEALSLVNLGAVGNGGNVVIKTDNLEVLNDALLSSSILGSGENAGSVEITAQNHVHFDRGLVFSIINSGASGRGGDVIITADTVEVLNGKRLQANTLGDGDAGNVVINARDLVRVEGTSADGQFSRALSNVGPGGIGNAGNVIITADTLEVLDGARLIAATQGDGDAGNVEITAQNLVRFEGGLAFSSVDAGARGNGGDVMITTNILEVLDGGQLQSATLGIGDAGNVMITARNYVRFDGLRIDGQLASGAFSVVGLGATGSGGNVVVVADILEVLNGAVLNAATLGNGDAGNVSINANDYVQFSNGFAVSNILSDATGTGGNIEITADTVEVIDGGQLRSETRGDGNAGNVIVAANILKVLNDETQIVTATLGDGNAGNVEITADIVDVLNGGQLIASTLSDGEAGNVMIESQQRINLQGTNSFGQPSGIFTDSSEAAVGRGNNILITTPILQIQDGAVVFASTANAQPGGDIVLSLGRLAILNGGQVVTNSLGSGVAGTIKIDATDGILISGSDPTFADRANSNLSITEALNPQSTLSVQSSANGAAGHVVIGAAGTTPSVLLDNGGQINAESATVDGGNITLNLTGPLLLRNGSSISATAGTSESGGNGGNVILDVGFIFAVPQENSDITANAFEGDGGRVEINADGLFGIEFRDDQTPLSDITASSESGNPGVVNINTPEIDPTQGLTILPEEPREIEVTDSCQTAATQDSVEFFNLGRGGAPPSPGDVTGDQNASADWISLDLSESENAPEVISRTIHEEGDTTYAMNIPHVLARQLTAICQQN